MMDRRRTFVLAAAALTIATLSVHHPTADIRVVTHDAGDLAPRRVQAALDLGVVGVSVLVTWTADRLAR